MRVLLFGVFTAALKGGALRLIHLFGRLTADVDRLRVTLAVAVVDTVGRLAMHRHRGVGMAVILCAAHVARAVVSAAEGLTAGLLLLGRIRTADLDIRAAAAIVAVAHAVNHIAFQLCHDRTPHFQNFRGTDAYFIPAAVCYTHWEHFHLTGEEKYGIVNT